MLATVVGFLIVALLVGEIVYELRTGKLLARGWKVYAKREDNPMLFWSSVALEIFVALIIVGAVVLAVVSFRN
jgi:hypothetical protein